MNEKNKNRCNPPYDCLSGNCPYPDDCHRSVKTITKSETEFIKIAGLARGRHGDKYRFPLAIDIKHRRPGGNRLV